MGLGDKIYQAQREHNIKQSKMKAIKNTETISKDMTLAEAVSKYPKTIPVFLKSVFCHLAANRMESEYPCVGAFLFFWLDCLQCGYFVYWFRFDFCLEKT